MPASLPIGSSPRSRGPRRGFKRAAIVRRFIPAFAGTTRRPGSGLRHRAVHPRVRGDHSWCPVGAVHGTGSSPRSRGPLGLPVQHVHPTRFIPAFAGTTPVRHRRRRRGTVHPRVRGDHSGFSRAVSYSIGSSPRSRGPRRGDRDLRRRARFIPAFAGTTYRPRFAPARRSVHPRVRGDHVPDADGQAHRTGSSPRSRGPHPIAPCRRPVARFIPAFAGTTCAATGVRRTATVHPRVRGDHVPATLAGRKSAVHPRVRGDHLSGTADMDLYVGSSPRSRGPQGGERSRRLQRRFIPAFAGTTTTARTRP